MGVEESQSVCTPSSAAKRKRKLGGDSDDDDDDDDDSDDQPEDEEEEEEEEIKKVKKVETNDEVMVVPSLRILSNLTLQLWPWIFMRFASSYQDEVDQATSIEELEKQIEKLAKVCISSQYIRIMVSNINNPMSEPLGETDNGKIKPIKNM